jgi:DNA-binding transcriptional MocR family regulator
MNGHIILHREIMEWEWYQSPNVFRLYIHLLLKANYKDKKWQGQLVKRGELITSPDQLSSELRITYQSIRTALSKLKSSGYIMLRPTNRYTLITLVNYGNLQTATSKSNKQNNTQLTSYQQSNNKQLTTTKERNKENKVNKENIEVRRENFKKQVFEHSQYDSKILNGFYNYWSELSWNKDKMRFEDERFFEIDKRIKKWFSTERGGASIKSNNVTLSNR